MMFDFMKSTKLRWALSRMSLHRDLMSSSRRSRQLQSQMYKTRFPLIQIVIQLCQSIFFQSLLIQMLIQMQNKLNKWVASLNLNRVRIEKISTCSRFSIWLIQLILILLLTKQRSLKCMWLMILRSKRIWFKHLWKFWSDDSTLMWVNIIEICDQKIKLELEWSLLTYYFACD